MTIFPGFFSISEPLPGFPAQSSTPTTSTPSSTSTSTTSTSTVSVNSSSRFSSQEMLAAVAKSAFTSQFQENQSQLTIVLTSSSSTRRLDPSTTTTVGGISSFSTRDKTSPVSIETIISASTTSSFPSFSSDRTLDTSSTRTASRPARRAASSQTGFVLTDEELSFPKSLPEIITSSSVPAGSTTLITLTSTLAPAESSIWSGQSYLSLPLNPEMMEKTTGLPLEVDEKPRVLAVLAENILDGFPKKNIVVFKKLISKRANINKYRIYRKNVFLDKDFKLLIELESNELTVPNQYLFFAETLNVRRGDFFIYIDNSIENNNSYVYKIEVSWTLRNPQEVLQDIAIEAIGEAIGFTAFVGR